MSARATVELFTIDEAAEKLGVSPARLRMDVRDGLIPFVAVGTGTRRQKRMIRSDDLQALMPKPEEVVDFAAVRSERKLQAIDAAYRDKPSDGFVYFIRRREFVKIGFSQNPRQRLRQLSIATADKLELACAVRGSIRQEKLLHHKLARWRHSGEWFNLTDDVRAILDACKADPDALSRLFP